MRLPAAVRHHWAAAWYCADLAREGLWDAIRRRKRPWPTDPTTKEHT